jgi:hypothetical protein
MYFISTSFVDGHLSRRTVGEEMDNLAQDARSAGHLGVPERG